ncbi:MAG: MerR family transcriptional regulator [Oscillospiraceae bacterium]|nr:MerR family transcriptional regulator [Oscillospiraceae bacterium]
MSTYTTGEMAKLCGVTVRTVQFYDQKGVLHPYAESEGGRRIYNDDDLTKLRLICTLKSLGLSLDSIGGILQSEMCGKILSLLLEEQEKQLSEEISERQKQLEMIEIIKESIANQTIISANSILGVEDTMEKRKNSRGRKKLALVHALVGLLCVTQIAFLGWLVCLATEGRWWPIVAYLSFGAFGIVVSLVALKGKEYICPKCDAVFKPPLWRAFFTTGNNKVRWTKCPDCGHKDWCVIRKREKA